MSDAVNLYGSLYSTIAEDVYRLIRRVTYGADFGQSSWVTGEEYRRFFELLKLKAADHVLDVGCGSGGPAIFMAEEVGCRVTGIEVDAAGIQAGTKLAATKGLDTTVMFRQVDGSGKLPFANGLFDAVVCVDAICHLCARAELLGDWFRILRPGGRILFTDPVVLTGLVTKDELAARSSTGHFEFCPVGVNERLIGGAGFVLKATEDVTENEATISLRWHDAREKNATELIALEGEAAFAGLQGFLATVHRLTRERRLSRYVYLGIRPE